MTEKDREYIAKLSIEELLIALITIAKKTSIKSVTDCLQAVRAEILERFKALKDEVRSKKIIISELSRIIEDHRIIVPKIVIDDVTISTTPTEKS